MRTLPEVLISRTLPNTFTTPILYTPFKPRPLTPFRKARQRGALTEKLARRRALADQVNVDEEASMSQLDAVTSHLVQTAKKAKKCPQLSTDEVCSAYQTYIIQF